MKTLEQDAEQYAEQIAAAHDAFARGHPGKYREIVENVMLFYRAEPGGFRDRMREVERVCAAEWGLKSFNDWSAAA